MSNDRFDEDDLAIQRAARALRASERFSDDFEQTLVEAIRADRPLRRVVARRTRPLTPAWWAAPASIRFSRLTGLAMAAGIAALTVVGTMRLGTRTQAGQHETAQAVHDTVTFVRFVFVGQARTVTLVGDFNRWGGEPIALSPTASGAWTVSVPMTNGRHEYAFIVDGARWIPDPLAQTSSDDFDTKSSIISVGT